MFKLVIVDDEKYALEGLKQFIESNNHEFEIVGAFKNGKEAMEYISENVVHAVITDIKMPVMNGLELAEYIFNNHRHIQVAIVSGYDEFDYARRAIIYNVKSYILKPVDPDEIEKLLDTFISNIENDNMHNKKELTSQNHFLIEVTPDLLDEEGKISSNLIIKKAKEYIEANFTKEISREDVAHHVYVSPEYFSRIFKQVTNENFIDYLIRLRMVKAIEMLEKGLKINEIAEGIGYHSSRYFSRLFKKFTGYKPSDYRRLVLKIEDVMDDDETP